MFSPGGQDIPCKLFESDTFAGLADDGDKVPFRKSKNSGPGFGFNRPSRMTPTTEAPVRRRIPNSRMDFSCKAVPCGRLTQVNSSRLPCSGAGQAPGNRNAFCRGGHKFLAGGIGIFLNFRRRYFKLQQGLAGKLQASFELRLHELHKRRFHRGPSSAPFFGSGENIQS